MATTKYQIIDEPSPGPWAHVISNPMWPMIAQMIGGAWLAWPWFAVNAHALGGATKRRELTLLGAALGGTIVLALLAAMTARAAGLADFTPAGKAFGYALLGVRAFKLTMGYLVFLEQRRSFQIYEASGGKASQAWILLAAAYPLRSLILGATDNLVLLMILA